MIKSETIGKLVEALAKAQIEFSPILKKNENPGFKRDGKASKYADLATTIESTQPALVKNGLVVTQFPVSTDTRVGVLSILAHTSGEFIGQEFTLPIAKQDAQTGVAGITYARRTSYQGITGCAAEDDDGNQAAGRNQPAPEPEVYPYSPYAEPVDEVAQTAKKPVTVVTEHTTIVSKQVEPCETLAEAGIPSGGPLPSPEQFDKYTARLRNLREKLQTEGKLKPSAGLPASRKMLNYIKKVTGQEDLKQVSTVQFDSFFQFAEKTDPESLVKLINEANTKGGK